MREGTLRRAQRGFWVIMESCRLVVANTRWLVTGGTSGKEFYATKEVANME